MRLPSPAKGICIQIPCPVRRAPRRAPNIQAHRVAPPEDPQLEGAMQ